MVSTFNQIQFNHFIIENKIIGFFPTQIKLSSGRMTHWYVNWRNASHDAFLLDQLSGFVLAFLKTNNLQFDGLYGVPEGATKLAVITQFKWSSQQKDFQSGKYFVSMGRKVPKEYGDPKDRFFVGDPKGKIVVIEDVTTTGGSLLKTVIALKEMKMNVVGAVALTNRNELTDSKRHVSQELADLEVQYFSMSEAVQLLPMAVKAFIPSEEIITSINQEFLKYGQKPLTLK